MKKINIFLLSAIVISGCAKMKVQGLSDGSYNSGSGLLYKLPRTCIAFKINVKATTYTQAACFLKNKEEIPFTIDKKIIAKLTANEEYTAYKITGIELVTLPVDDPDKFFMLETNTKTFQDRTYGVALSSQGFMTNSTLEAKDNTLDVATEFISSAVSIASSIALKRGQNADNTKLERYCTTQLDNFNNIQKERFDFSRLRNMPVGIDFPDAELYKTVLSEYDKAEIQFFNNAFFSTDITYNSCIIYFTPKSGLANIKNEKLFSYDATNDKLIINEKLSGEVRFQNGGITTVDIKDLNVVNGDKTFRYLNIEPEATSSPLDQRFAGISSGTAQGLRYNIPKQCVLSLFKYAELPSVKGSLQIPQWGAVGRMNEKLSKITVALNPETGALVSATLESKGISAEQVKSAMTAASGFTGFFTRDKDAEALAKLDNKIKLLEAKDKLGKLETGEDATLITLRKEAELLTEKKNIAELKGALKKLEEEQ